MKDLFKSIVKILILMLIGGALYVSIEILYRNMSTREMFYCGALAFYTIGLINEFISWEMPLMLQGIIAGCIATFWEGLFGITFNMDYHIWNYTKLPGSFFYSQCNIFFVVLWCLLGTVAILLDDYLRYKLFNEEKPYYYF